MLNDRSAQARVKIDLLQQVLQKGLNHDKNAIRNSRRFRWKAHPKDPRGRRAGSCPKPRSFRKGQFGGQGRASSLEASSSIVTKGFVEFNAKALEALQANLSLSLEYFSALASVKSPADAAKLPAELAKKQMEALTAQAKDLTALAQKIAGGISRTAKEQFQERQAVDLIALRWRRTVVRRCCVIERYSFLY